jgi:ABC-type enterochelin transport system permease subunit
MSDPSILAMIGALFVSFAFLLYYSTAKFNDRGHEILTGVIGGVPISARYRRLLLWVTWLPQVAGAVVGEIIFAAMFVVLARHAAEADVRTLAYLCAGAAGFGALFSLVLGVPYANLLASAVRETE